MKKRSPVIGNHADDRRGSPRRLGRRRGEADLPDLDDVRAQHPEAAERFTFIEGDICDLLLLDGALRGTAAQPQAVDASDGPQPALQAPAPQARPPRTLERSHRVTRSAISSPASTASRKNGAAPSASSTQGRQSGEP